ncbi:MAG TPA: NPCBM/NEW2 domain-containing protein [Pirellulales bacterium]|nr:NPCBM/NEW2 domain-containing protein [Pirellulales bacterium]
MIRPGQSVGVLRAGFQVICPLVVFVGAGLAPLRAPCLAQEDAAAPAAAAAAAAPAANAPPATEKPAEAQPAAPAAAQPAAAQPAPQPVPSGPSVTTVYDERIAAKVAGIEEGQLVIATDPVRKIPLEEVSLVDLGNAPDLSAEWVGQVNHDVVQVGGAAGGNGIQDVQIRLRGLADGKNVKQIVALTRGGKGRGIWRLDTARTPNWKLALERNGTSSSADVYVEPINQDCFDREIEVTVTYEDGSAAKTSLKVTTHTDHQLKVGAAAVPAAESAGPPNVTVYGRDKSLVRGELVSLDDESVAVKTGWSAEPVKLALASVRGIGLTSVGTAADRAQFDARLADPAAEDTALVLGREKELSQVTGVAHGVSEGKLKFTFEGEDRSINVGRLIGIVYAKGPKKASDAKPYQIAHLLSGDLLAGRWQSADDKQLSLQTAWGPVAVPRSAVARVVFRNGKVTFVSDLEPLSVEQVPYFGRLIPWCRDQAFDGGPLKLKGKTYSKGLAVHSRCVLTYAIDGEYESFKATVGFDESSRGRGRVVCRVLGDEKELFVNPDLAATADPVAVEVALSGVKQLSLEVDFGEAEDTGDRVIWADARLFRAEKK